MSLAEDLTNELSQSGFSAIFHKVSKVNKTKSGHIQNLHVSFWTFTDKFGK